MPLFALSLFLRTNKQVRIVKKRHKFFAYMNQHVVFIYSDTVKKIYNISGQFRMYI